MKCIDRYFIKNIITVFLIKDLLNYNPYKNFVFILSKY